jgi:hypothetical protein
MTGIRLALALRYPTRLGFILRQPALQLNALYTATLKPVVHTLNADCGFSLKAEDADYRMRICLLNST